MKEFYIVLISFIGVLLGLIVYLYWSVVSEDRKTWRKTRRENRKKGSREK